MADDDRASKIEHENKMIRRLRLLVELTFAAVARFSGKEETFDLVFLPRCSGLLAERFGAN